MKETLEKSFIIKLKKEMQKLSIENFGWAEPKLISLHTNKTRGGCIGGKILHMRGQSPPLPPK